MPLPFRSNPDITANWTNIKSGKFQVGKAKKAYYEISASKKPGKIDIILREEKKRLGGSAEREEFWYSYLDFPLDSAFAKDLKMFLNEYVVEDSVEEKNTVRVYYEKGRWCARLSEKQAGYGDSIGEALEDLGKLKITEQLPNTNKKDELNT